MSKRIITISREFGSGGHFIGEEVSKKLGIAYYDKEIIAKVAQETGLAKDFIEENGEYAPSKNIFAYAFVGRNGKGESLEDTLAAAQRKIISEVAEKESCVIVGRGADYILRDRNDCINVFIYGNEEKKMERIQKLYKKTESEAKKLMHDVDKKRAVHYQYYTEQEWGLARNYTISLDSSTLGYERIIGLLTELYSKL